MHVCFDIKPGAYRSSCEPRHRCLRRAPGRGTQFHMLARGACLAALLLGVVVSLPARAQTPYAPGGLFVHPTAFTPPPHQFSIYAAAFTQDEAGGSNESYYPLSVTYTPTDRLQVSALMAYHQGSNEASHTHLGGFLKYQLTPDTRTHPAFALAGGYAGRDHLESTVAGVASHAFLNGNRIVTTLHMGVKWGRESDNNGGQDDVGAFVGAQIPLSREWGLVGETSTRFKFDRSAASSIGFMYHTRRGTGISVGLVNGGRSSRMKLFFGVGFPLGH
jgi:hypothetical protein